MITPRRLGSSSGFSTERMRRLFDHVDSPKTPMIYERMSRGRPCNSSSSQGRVLRRSVNTAIRAIHQILRAARYARSQRYWFRSALGLARPGCRLGKLCGMQHGWARHRERLSDPAWSTNTVPGTGVSIVAAILSRRARMSSRSPRRSAAICSSSAAMCSRREWQRGGVLPRR